MRGQLFQKGGQSMFGKNKKLHNHITKIMKNGWDRGEVFQFCGLTFFRVHYPTTPLHTMNLTQGNKR